MQIRTVGKSVFFYAIGIVNLRAASFLLIPIYTHFLNIEEFGILSTIFITIQLMLYIMPLGTWESVCKYYENQKNANLISDLFGTSLIVNLFGGVVTSILALTLFLPLLNKYIPSKNIVQYVFLACLISYGSSLCQLMTAYYRAQNKSVSYMLAGTISSIILIALTLIFVVVLKKEILGALYAQVITYVVVFLVIFVKLIGKFKFNFSFHNLKSLISFGVPLVLSSVSMFIIQSSSVYFLGYLGTLKDIAIFSLGYKFAAVLFILITGPFQLAFAPYFYSHSHSPELKSYIPRIFLYVSFFSTFLAYSILFLFKLFFPLIAPSSYSASYNVCLFLIPGISFLSIKIIGEAILYNFNKTAYCGVVTLIFAFVNLLLNSLFIPHFKIYGAVASSSLTMVLLSITIFKLGVNRYPFSINIKKVALIIAMLTLLIVSFFLIRNLSLPIFIAFSFLLFVIILLFFFSNLFFELADRIQIKKLVFQIGSKRGSFSAAE